MQPSQYHHVLFTRFNVRWTDAYPYPGHDPAWLRDRFVLFERFCLPSVRAQSCQDFTWLVFFDTETPEPFRHRINEYAKELPVFVPVFVPKFSVDVLTEALGDRQYLAREYLVTSRLDNDDALAANYMARVQKWLIKHDPSDSIFLNFLWGCVIVGKRLFLGRDPKSHFATLVEPSTNPIIVYRNHVEMEKWGRVEQIAGPPAWLEVRHPNRLTDKNVCRSWMPLLCFMGKQWFPAIKEFELFSIHDALVYPFRLLAWSVFRAGRAARARVRRLATPARKSG